MTCERLDGAQLADALEARVEELLTKGCFVATVGGEHTSIIGAVWAHTARYPSCSVLHLDAHSDLREEYEGSPWNHACAAARVLERHPHLVQAGIRSQAAEEHLRAEAEAIPIAYAHDIHRRHVLGEDWATGILAVLRPQVYITLDLDVLDCGLMPATGTPEPGGLDWPMLNHLLHRLFAAREVIGFDISELAPIPTLHHPQFTAAKLLYRMLGYWADNLKGSASEPET
jgi:agmatinase